MALTIDQIIAARAPQFSADPRKAAFEELAKLQTSTNFGDRYNLAVALRMCHWWALEQIAGGSSTNSGLTMGGTVKSETEGGLSRSYGNAGSGSTGTTNEDLSRTAFGVELLALIRSSFLKPRTRMMSTDG